MNPWKIAACARWGHRQRHFAYKDDDKFELTVCYCGRRRGWREVPMEDRLLITTMRAYGPRFQWVAYKKSPLLRCLGAKE